jgi:hypothetical protein
VSPARQRLARLLSYVQFGRVQNLHVRGGEPVFDPAPLVIRTLKLTGRPAVRPEPAPDQDGYLPGEVVDLLEHLARMGDGLVQRIEVVHGLPAVVELLEQPAA